MPTLTSEQAITAIEHSSKPTLELLDDAAAIIGFDLSETTLEVNTTASSVLRSDSAKFREQWILRWLIKRLTQAVNVKQTSEEDRVKLLSDEKIWRLLNYLLISIPQHASKAIILERDFCHVFSDCLAACISLAHSTSSTSGLQIADQADFEIHRPSKRRKLSRDQKTQEHLQASPSLQILVNVIRLASRLSEVLLAVDEADASHRRSVPSNWTNSIDEAAILIARLINASTIVATEVSRQVQLKDDMSTDLSDSMERWIELWQASMTAAQNQRKQTSSLAFANNVLIPALDLLASAKASAGTSISRALERQIATSCVLSMRAVFQKLFAASWDHASTWGPGEAEPQWTKIRKVVGTLTSHLGDSAAGFRTAQGEQRVATLLNIASRITPASDPVRRRADRSWIEALFLCLCLLQSTSDPTHNMVNGEMNSLSAVSTGGDTIPLPIFASDMSLDALQTTGIEPSAHFWHFYVRYSMSEGEEDIQTTMLAKMVKLNVSVFVPEGENVTPSLLSTFCAVLDKNSTDNKRFLRVVLDDILAPIWEEFGKRRRLSLLIQFWESKLLNAFHLRSASTAEQSSDLIWDHPDLLEIFSSVCQRHAPPSLCTEILTMAISDIAKLIDIVGPTHEIFAKVTLLGSMLKSMGRSSAVQQFVHDQDHSIHHLICKTISRKTDHQGHRWRLWKSLEIFVRSFPTTVDAKELPEFDLPWNHFPFDKPGDFDSRLPQLKPQLMELFQSFSCVVGLWENGGSDGVSNLTKVIKRLNELLKMYELHVKDLASMLQPWDGLSETMNSIFKVLSACLARLSRCSRTWYSLVLVPDDFLKNLATLSFGLKDAGFFTELATAAEATLTQLAAATNIDLLDTYRKALSKGVATRFPPPSLHSVVQGAASEQSLHDFAKVLFETIKDIDPDSHHESFLQYLCLITEAMTKHPGPVMSALDFTSYTRFLEVNTSEATTEQLAAAYQLIQQSTQQMFMQTAATWGDSETKSLRENLLKWTRKRLKETESSDEAEILEKYTGYLLLAVAQAAHKIDTVKASKKECKYIDEIREHHASLVISQCKLLVEEPPEEVQFWQVFVLLDSLVGPQHIKSADKKLQKCLQKVAQAIVDAEGVEPEGVPSTQRTRVIAKLWEVLSKYARPHKSGPIPDFPIAKFNQSIGEEGTEYALVLQAQLATKRPSEDSIVPLAKDLSLSKVEGQSEDVGSVSIAGSKTYLSIAVNIRSLKLDPTNTNAETIEVLGHIACLQTALDETSPASLIVRLELSKMVLDKHSSIVNQHVIDSTLTSITALASSASKATSTTDSTNVRPEYIFDRLCTILSTLLVRYRRRLTDRHHLLLPALQNLLKCLFYPGSRKSAPTSTPSKLTYLASLPPWLNSPDHTSTNTLPASSATKFSRLLQQLCDPSASSARHVSKRTNGDNNLTDDVKSLRREVSRHIQYLLQTYCQVMLDGYIAPDVKEKLLPGLYAAMNATDVEVMRGLNAAMDASQRAIWKDLYAEWRRFGRWNQR